MGESDFGGKLLCGKVTLGEVTLGESDFGESDFWGLGMIKSEISLNVFDPGLESRHLI